MRIVVQRCTTAKVRVKGEVVGQVGQGLMLLVGVGHEDGPSDATYCAEKIANLRIFEDDDNKMNRSLLEIGGEVLSISQFTLYGDVRKGRRPNFMAAAAPGDAEKLYEAFNACLKGYGIPVQTGVFGAMMEVDFVNDGPVTLLIDSERQF